MKRFTYIGLVLALAFGWCSSVWAQQTKKLPDVTSTEGRDFYVGWLLNGESVLTPIADPNLKLNLYISSREDNTIIVQTVGGSTTYSIAAGTTDTIVINPSIAYIDKGSDETEKVKAKGVRVYSQNGKVFSLFASNKNGITSEGTASFDATQVIPIEGLGCEYIIHTNDIDRFANQFMIVGTANGTEVTINLSADSKNHQASAAYPTVRLGAGEVYLVTTSKPNEDFSGTTICATQPVAVFNGSTSVLIPNQNGMTDDHAYEQAMPITKWGKQFVVPMTANYTSANMLEIMAQKDGTSVTISGHSTQSQKTLSAGEAWRIELNTVNCTSGVVFVGSTEPVATYLYTTSAGRNSYTHPVSGEYTLQGDPSSTLIPPIEHFTDSTIFFTYKNPDEGAQLVAYVNIWAKTSALSSLKMDGNTIPSSEFQTVAGHTQYSFARIPIDEGTHVVTASEKAFTGYTYMLDAGQASLYTIGYDFTPKEDSLFLKGEPGGCIQVHGSEWKANAIGTSENGWYLDRTLLDDGTYLLDSIFICDSTTLDFPIKTNNDWYQVRWEIESSLGRDYYTPTEQLEENVDRPELEHQFLLLPSERNRDPYEDFEVRGILIRKPILCDIQPEYWERDTFNTVVRVMRQYNDTTWRAICKGDTVEFFSDTVWSGSTYTMRKTIFNDTTHNPSGGFFQYGMGAQFITRPYISSGGCDSLSTLALYVCPRWFTHKDTVVCEDDLRDLEYGEFFQEYSQDNSWPIDDVVLRDTLWTKGCMLSPDFEPFSEHCPSFHGCDSVLELHLKVKPLITNGYTINQCKSLLPANHIVEWREKESGRLIQKFWADTMEYNKIYSFRESVQYTECTACPSKGCDSVRNVLRLQFVSDEGQYHTVHVCQGKDTIYRNQTNAQASQTFSATGEYGKVGSYVFDLLVKVMGQNDEGAFVELCSFNDQVTFIVDTAYDNQMDYDTICWDPLVTDQTYSWANHPNVIIPVKRPGLFTYVDTLKTAACNCDSICKLELRVGQPYTVPTDTIIYDDESYVWQDTLFYGSKYKGNKPAKSKLVAVGVYYSQRDTVSQYGCDSILTLTLHVGQVFRDTTYDATCVNCGTYNWIINSPITGEDTTIYITDLPLPYNTMTYYDSLVTAVGFDSIYVLRLTGYPTYSYEADGEICQGEEFIWVGHESVSIPTDRHGTFDIVDRLQTTDRYINPKTQQEKAMQCDSIWTLHLTVHPTYNYLYNKSATTDYRSMASNDTISHFVSPHTLFVGYDFDSVAAGVTHAELEAQYDRVVYMYPTGNERWIDSVKNTSIYGCDSVHYVQIAICEIKFWEYTDSIADNDTTWFFGGDTELGEHTLPLITGEHFHYYDEEEQVPVKYDSAVNRTMREYFYIDTMRTANGCDSIVHLTLHVFPSYRFQFDTAVCSNKAYYWEGHGTTKYNERGTGVYYDSINYTVGTHVFDSVYVLNLQVMPSGYWEYDTMLCMNDTITWHFQQVYYRPGGLQFVEAAYQSEASPCGEVHHMNLHFKPFYGSQLVEYDTICQEDPYPWISPGETKEHTEALYDEAGNKLEFIPTDVAGDFVYYDSLKTVGCGCDSVYTLHLHIYPTHRVVTDTAICIGVDFPWIVTDDDGHDSIIHYQSDVTTHFFDTIPGQTTNGCDSSFYLHVFVDQPYDIYIDTALCAADEHFTWNGKSYDDLIAASSTWIKPQEFYDTIFEKTVRGHCDSTMYLHLTIAPSGDSIWTDSMCIGETYMLFEQAITQAGYYEMRHENYWGCEMNYKLTLENIPATIFHLSVDPVCFDEEGVANNYILRYTYEGEFAPVSYSLKYDSVAHSVGFEDEEDVPLYGAQTLALPVPSVAAKSYPRPGYYNVVIAFKNGVCLTDSLMRYPFKMEMRYPSWIMEQRHNDVIALLNENYNGGGYVWSAYQWYENDQVMEGQTKPYLHVPTGLTPDAAYSVALTRTDDNVTVRTCPIIATYKTDAIVPTMGYLSVTPTCVVPGHPYVNILSRHDGTYRVTTDNGQHVSDGIFRADVTEIRLPETEGLYIVQLWSDATPEEPYRAIKVLVSKQCPNCDTSSF